MQLQSDSDDDSIRAADDRFERTLHKSLEISMEKKQNESVIILD